MFKTIALAIAAQQVYAEKVTRECQYPSVKQNFNKDGYFGTWYEQLRDKEVIYENGICNTANYSLKEDGDVRVRNDELETDTESWGGGTGKAWIKEPEKHEGRLMVKFVPFIPAGEYQILDTDYKSYSVVYTCETMPGVPYKTEYVWVLTREAVPDPSMMSHCLGIIADKVPKYDMSYLV